MSTHVVAAVVLSDAPAPPDPGRWFFRIVEDGDGEWECRRGSHVIDRHPDHADAFDHITDIATAHRPSRVYVHYADGGVRAAATFD